MDEDRELTEEELRQLEDRKKEMIKYWEDETEFLTKQLNYEMLLTNIEEARMRRLSASYSIARLMAPPPKETGEGTDSKESKEPKERTLKKS